MNSKEEKKIVENIPPENEDTEPTENVDDLKKRHEKELDEFREKLSQTEQELQEQLDYQKDLEEKPQKTVINIDESVNINPTDEVKKKKD